jgi:hypothetical protein
MENLRLHNVSPKELLERLLQWESRKLDLIVPHDQVFMGTAEKANVISFSTRPEIVDPTIVMHKQLSDKLNIPWRYYERLMNETHDFLLHDNVNKLLADVDKNYLFRMYRSSEEDGGMTIGRAFLSDKYKTIDHVPIIQTVMTAIQESGVTIQVEGCDISEKRMSIRFFAPDVMTDAKEFLQNYRNPENGSTDGGVFAGFQINNSETGHGRYTLAPRVLQGVCSNGLLFMNHAIARTHVGAQQEEGEIKWSEETLKKEMAWVMSATRDYVKEFTSKKYLKKLIDEVSEKAAPKLLYPIDATVNLCSEIGLNADETATVMKFFIESGDTSRGGAINAATYFAHEQADPDTRYEIESKAINLLDKFAALDKKNK